jgi:outer membrane phospholipase A
MKLFLSIFICFLFSVSLKAEDSNPERIGLYKYKPIYFLMGTPYTKIQFSFEVQVVRSLPVYFAYNQLMLWDLFRSSPYFYDINYNPLVFYRLNFSQNQAQWLDLIAWEHESNGKGGDLEKAWDRVAVSYHFENKVGHHSKLSWDLKAWFPFRYNPNNQNLADYRGLWEVTVGLSQFLGDSFEYDDLILRIYPGGPSKLNPISGGQELTFRVKTNNHNFMPLWIAQVFHGYGEYLMDYNQNHWGIRAGLGF